MMPEKVYNVLKWIQRIFLPAVVVLLGAIGTAVNWDCTTVVAIVAAVDVFLGSILQIDYSKYVKSKEEDNE